MTVRLLPVDEGSQVGAVRRAASELAVRSGFNEVDAGRVALVATELATNLLKHAGKGSVVLYGVREGETDGVEMLALDRGPGMANLSECLRDGFSRTGSPGTGLGALQRVSSRISIYAPEGLGTSIAVTIWPTGRIPTPPPVTVSGFSIPHPSEEVCGDAWATALEGQCVYVIVADGLGHGIQAADASRLAGTVFRQAPKTSPAELLSRLHLALRPTRGASVAIAKLDAVACTVHFAGVGNIAGYIWDPAGAATSGMKAMVSFPGTLGHEARTIREFAYPWPGSGTMVMCSDGIGTRLDPGAYPGLISKAPNIIAGVLFRDYRRERDDATVVVARRSGDL